MFLQYLLWIQRALLIAIGFSLPISTALPNLLFGLLLITTILHFGLSFPKIPISITKNPIIWSSFSLLALMIIGSFYSAASYEAIIDNLKQYKEFLLIPLFLYGFQDQIARAWGFKVFLAAMGLTLALSIFVALTNHSLFGLIHGDASNAFVFKNHITQGLLIVMSAYFVAVLAYQKRIWWPMVIVGLAIYDVIFLTQGRTGYLILACLIVLFSWQVLRWRGFLIGSLAVMILGITTYYTSSNLQHRVDKVIAGLKHQAAETDSIQLRLNFYKHSWQLWQQQPIIGSGTGSFTQRYAVQEPSHPTSNPHSEYLMMAVQWGILGLGVFLWFLYQLWYLGLKLPKPQMAQGLFATIVVGCLVNSLFLDFTEGHVFAYLIGIFYSDERLYN
ncbi:O-antigen ligase family protein [Candidatus Albibeggiatoa sp. nov. NOAA]|uniref:O-antigen ligase family protein n=1 Tax=Candidatus Albibeggiatoa sp. nov. NOAA TaxID=3162724 RepID=UPI0032FB731F|nr:O-antigen ligase family protein [Thiotrichaceae bacterium]